MSQAYLPEGSLYFPESLDEIHQHRNWKGRLSKPPAQFSSEAQGDAACRREALTMNIFCHPQLSQWDGLKMLLGCTDLTPNLFVEAPLDRSDRSDDPTTVDLAIDDAFCQSSLSEKHFTEQPLAAIERYAHFDQVFGATRLPRRDDKLLNARVIRNLLAASQYEMRYILFCDRHRTDLLDAYQVTIDCLKDDKFRRRCRVVFWQDLLQVVDPDLSMFVRTRFGLLA